VRNEGLYKNDVDSRWRMRAFIYLKSISGWNGKNTSIFVKIKQYI